MSLFLRAYWNLLIFDWYLQYRSFKSLYLRVRDCPIGPQPTEPDTTERVCSAIDKASIWYRKEVLCLQRAAAATCMLRRQGIAAQLVIGAQQTPFRAHAWVEVDGVVVGDRPWVQEIYAVLDRC